MKTTILLVEDDLEVRTVLSELLALDGVESWEAANGLEAWKILESLSLEKKKYPNLVLSDIAMPKMNGFELLNKLRNDPRFRDLPVVLTSGNSDRVKAELQAGESQFEPNAFFAKPFDFAVLTETILRLADRN